MSDQNRPPLYDPYGNLIQPSLPPTPIEATDLAKSPPSTRVGSLWQKAVTRFREMPLSVRLAVDTIGFFGILLTVYWAYFQFRQDIAVDPYVTYDSSDPFSQRFSISNNGPFAIYDIHYTCAVTHLNVNSAVPGLESLNVIEVMVPAEPHMPILKWKEKGSTDCDFIARYGLAIIAVRIEIDVFYRRWGWPRVIHGPGWKFSAIRGTDGRFIWDYGSPDKGLFEDESRPAVFIPFNGKCCPFDPQLLYSDFLEIVRSSAARRIHKAIASTMLPCGGPCRR